MVRDSKTLKNNKRNKICGVKFSASNGLTFEYSREVAVMKVLYSTVIFLLLEVRILRNCTTICV